MVQYNMITGYNTPVFNKIYVLDKRIRGNFTDKRNLFTSFA